MVYIIAIVVLIIGIIFGIFIGVRLKVSEVPNVGTLCVDMDSAGFFWVEFSDRSTFESMKNKYLNKQVRMKVKPVHYEKTQ